jgi:hypothetical protein
MMRFNVSVNSLVAWLLAAPYTGLVGLEGFTAYLTLVSPLLRQSTACAEAFMGSPLWQREHPLLMKSASYFFHTAAPQPAWPGASRHRSEHSGKTSRLRTHAAKSLPAREQKTCQIA